jgi:ferrous iron transport protein B
MIDLAERDGLEIDPARLSAALGVPVLPTVAVRKRGLDALKATLDDVLAIAELPEPAPLAIAPDDVRTQYARQAKNIARNAIVHETASRQWTRMLDRILLHPFIGPSVLLALLFVMFQAVFSWSQAPIGWIEALFALVSDGVTKLVPPGLFRSMLVDGGGHVLTANSDPFCLYLDP